MRLILFRNTVSKYEVICIYLERVEGRVSLVPGSEESQIRPGIPQEKGDSSLKKNLTILILQLFRIAHFVETGRFVQGPQYHDTF